MSVRRLISALCLSVSMAGCASGYVNADSTWTGGFEIEKVSEGRWLVSYFGNGYTTNETVLTYWLYRSSELAIAEGYDGFAVMSSGRYNSAVDRLVDEGLSGKPGLTAGVVLLKTPIPEEAGVNFDAKALKAFLERYVKGPKCDGNVCPHVHEYLFPGFGKATS